MTVKISVSERALSFRMPLIRRLAGSTPLALTKILLYSLAVVIHEPQIELCRRKTLVGGLSIPFKSLSIVLCHSFPIVKHNS